MKKKYHILSTIVFLVIIAYIFEKVTVTLCIAAFIYCLIPDLDQLDGIKQFLGHRNFLTHSIILWVIVLVFNWEPIFFLVPAVVGLHCLVDVKFRRKKQVGFYTITLAGSETEFGYRLNGKWSTFYLVMNFIAGLTILLVWCLL